MKVAAIVIASTAALALTACGGSTPAPTVTVTVAASSTPTTSASETPTPEPSSSSPSAEPTIEPGATAAEVAAALGCGNVKPKKITSGSNGGLPKASSEVSCSDDGVKYVVTVYKSENALTQVLLFTNAIVASSIRKPWTYGAGDTWVIGAGGESLQPLPDSMVARVEAAGGVIKTIKPA